MFNIGEVCKYCNLQIPWEQGYVNQFIGMTEQNQIELCDNCKTYFCKDCFVGFYGREAFKDMMNKSRYQNGKVLCPICYERS